MLWFTDSCNPTSKHGVWATFVLASQHSISKFLLLSRPNVVCGDLLFLPRFLLFRIIILLLLNPELVRPFFWSRVKIKTL